MQVYAQMTGKPRDQACVPVENEGEPGDGTWGSHWRESVFTSELMTGFANPGEEPLTRLTIASFEDLGYKVRMPALTAADFPPALQLQPQPRLSCCPSREGSRSKRH
jgi:hypothetical protein